MRQVIFALTILLCITPVMNASGQNLQLMVRVFDNSAFVKGLKCADFEVILAGKACPVSALARVEGSRIANKDGKLKISAELARHFTLVFMMKNYYPQLDNGIEHFFNQILSPGDSLTIVTPNKSYSLRREVLQQRPKKQLARQLKSLLRRDIQLGAAEYKNLTRSMENLVKTNVITGTALMEYEGYLNNLEVVRGNEQKTIISVLKQQKPLKKVRGVFILYERELKPNYTVRTLSQAKSDMQDEIDVQAKLSSLFEVYNREVRFNTKALAAEFCGQPIILNFVMFRNQFDNRANVNMIEQVEDVFGLFNPLAMATGGTVETSGNPSASFLKALDFFKQYYILEVSVGGGSGAGKAGKLKIAVKGNQTYKVHHISGYN